MWINIHGISFEGSPNLSNAKKKLITLQNSLVQSGWKVQSINLEMRQVKDVPKASLKSSLHYFLVSLYLSSKQPEGKYLKLKFLRREARSISYALVYPKSEKSQRHNRAYIAKDMLLTDKHVRIWNNLANSNCEYGLIFTDDLVQVKPDAEVIFSFLSIKEYLKDQGMAAYFDISTPYGRDILERDLNLKFDLAGHDIFTGSFFSNTSACYFISKTLATRFLEILSTEVWLRAGSIDWLITHLGRTLQRESDSSYHSLTSELFRNQSLVSGSTLI